MTKPKRDCLTEIEPRRNGGEYSGFCLAPPREAHLRAEDAHGLRLGIYWHVWTAFRDPKLVWC